MILVVSEVLAQDIILIVQLKRMIYFNVGEVMDMADQQFPAISERSKALVLHTGTPAQLKLMIWSNAAKQMRMG